MSITLTLSGTTSNLKCDFFPPIQLEGSWEMALLNFESFNSIPNVTDGAVVINDTLIRIPTGSYEVEDLGSCINTLYGHNVVRINGNRNTLKTEILPVESMIFDENISKLLGFEEEMHLVGLQTYTSTNPTNITKVNVLRIDCNVVQGSFLNGKKTHCVHEFCPNVPPGYRIIEVPNSLIYYSINTTEISSLTLNILDQSNREVDFRGETVTIRVHLRQIK